MIARARTGALVPLMLLAGCQAVPPPEATAPPPQPPMAPPPAPALQSSLGWEEAPVAAGSWHYAPAGRTRAAAFGLGGNDDRVVIACEAGTRQIALLVVGAENQPARPITIRTSFGALSWSGSAAPADGPIGLRVTRPASDPALDQIAYSRGRVSIEVAGSARLIVPVQAEISRVIEDCRN